jgi:hypothetical protein
MVRVQVDIGEELDKVLSVAAVQRRTSKGALIRQAAAAQYTPGKLQSDALMRMAGMLDGRPHDSASIDDVVYDRR